MNRQDSESDYRLDEIDRRIIYELMTDARTSSAPKITEAVNVSPGTIRNRIDRLEEHGIVTGYHAHVDFERTSGRLTALFMCNVPFAERESVAHAAYAIPGVVNVRLLMGGRRNFHALTVEEDTNDLQRVGTALSEIGVEIEEEMLVEHVLNDEPLIIALEREGEILTPYGNTRVRPDDDVAVPAMKR